SNYTTFAPSGATVTSARAVSGNNVAGFYTDGTGTHGFLYDGTNFTTIDAPGSTTTYATGIDGNTVVGIYIDNDGVYHGFQYTASVPEPSSLILFGLAAVVSLSFYKPSGILALFRRMEQQ